MPINPTILVSAIVKNQNGEYLFICNPTRGWEPPGGHVEEGEDLPLALTREVKEETGLEIEIGSLMGIFHGIRSTPKLLFVFSGHVVGGQMRTSNESLAIAWLNPDEANSLIEQTGTLLRFKQLVKFDGRIMYQAFTNSLKGITPCYEIHMERFL